MPYAGRIFLLKKYGEKGLNMSNKKNIMVISFCVPYDNVGHAGGKTHNYYLKKMSEISDFKVNLISFGVESDREKVDLNQYGIGNHIYYINNKGMNKLIRGIQNLTTKYNPFDKRGNMLPKYYEDTVIRELKRLKSKGQNPHIFILEWTQMVFLAGKVKSLFPNAKIVASEHDVSYLGYFRKYKYAENDRDKKKMFRFYKNIKLEELGSFKYCDIVSPHNKKDEALLVEDGVYKNKIYPIVPYFDNYSEIKRKPIKNKIMFYGAMSRPENYLSAMWFIENVMPALTDKNVEFVIVGSNPPKELEEVAKAYNKFSKTSKIIVTGFVLLVDEYFENSMFMVAPLVLGAGIKVKIIEAMSAGMPVLTNDIGIEGIDAKNRRDYLHCTSKTDYINTIYGIINGKIEINEISKNARNFISNHFNLEESAKEYMKRLAEL